MRKLKSGLLCLALSLGCAAPLRAQESADTLQFKLGLGYADLKFVDRSSRNFKSRYAFLDFGVTKTFGRLFITFNTELPFSQGGDMDESSNTAVMNQVESADLAVGYAVIGGLSVFGGWHHAKYDFLRSGSVTSQTQHVDDGPFVGAGYGFQLGKGNLAFSIARGKFDGELKNPGSTTITSAPGTSSGNSYAIIWSGDFRHDLTYFVRFRVLDYQFTVDPGFESTSIKNTVEKKISMLSAGITF